MTLLTRSNAATKTRRIEVLRAGTFSPMEGTAVTFSAADLAALATSYDPEGSPAPIVVGHPKTDDPAYGWARSFAFDEATGRLTAEIGDIAPEFENAVGEGRYKKISLSLFGPTAPGNPKPGHWYPKHIGFLGAAAPAVPGLKPVQFASADGAVTFEFADGQAFKDVASLFRRVREFFIGEFGLEKADQALPDWTINWINEAADRRAPGDEPADPAYFSTSAEAAVKPSKTKETAMADEAALALREREVEARERALAHSENVAFVSGLVRDVRLLPAQEGNAVALLDALAGLQSQTVSFASAGGEKADTALLDAAKAMLSANPPIVSLGAMDVGSAPDEISLANASDIAMRAQAIVAEQATKGVQISIADAIDQVNKGAGK